MLKTFLVILSGLIFGFGISLSGMTNPTVVINFLDISSITTHQWNPALLFVMLGAVSTTFFGFKWVNQARKPVFDAQFHTPTSQLIDVQLILGASLFGIGWGLSGYCPGAVLAALMRPNVEVLVFFVAMFGAMQVYSKGCTKIITRH